MSEYPNIFDNANYRHVICTVFASTTCYKERFAYVRSNHHVQYALLNIG